MVRGVKAVKAAAAPQTTFLCLSNSNSVYIDTILKVRAHLSSRSPLPRLNNSYFPPTPPQPVAAPPPPPASARSPSPLNSPYLSDVDEDEEETADADASDDVPPPLEGASTSAMEEID